MTTTLDRFQKDLRARARADAGKAKPVDPMERVRGALDRVLESDRRHAVELTETVAELRSEIAALEARHAEEIELLQRRHRRELHQLRHERAAEMDKARRAGQIETRCRESVLGLRWR